MKILYMPATIAAVAPVAQSLPTGVSELSWIEALGLSINTSINNAIDGSSQAIQDALYGALNQFKEDLFLVLSAQWVKFVDTSFILCLAIAFAGAIAGIMGIKKGYQVTLISILFYLFLRFFSWGMGWY